MANTSQIYTSTDSGVSWTARESSRNWQAVGSSADGSKLFTAVISGQIYASLNERTTAGTAGSLRGSQYDAVMLQYIGGNLFLPLSSTSYSGGFTVY